MAVVIFLPRKILRLIFSDALSTIQTIEAGNLAPDFVAVWRLRTNPAVFPI
jgi:hypothetical protein